jgi:hypothetical protein
MWFVQQPEIKLLVKELNLSRLADLDHVKSIIETKDVLEKLLRCSPETEEGINVCHQQSLIQNKL